MRRKPLNRRFAFLACDFPYQFWYKVTGEPGPDFGDEFPCAVVVHLEVRDSVCVVQLVQVVGEDSLRKQLVAQFFKRCRIVVHSLQQHALVEQRPAAETQVPEHHLRFLVELVGVVHVRNKHAFEAGGQFAEEFEVLHGNVGADYGEPRMDAKRCHGAVHGDSFYEVAEFARAERERVAAREDDFPDIRVRVEPVAHMPRDVGNVLERVVLAEAETAAHTAGGGRYDEGALVVFLDDAVGLACGEVAHGIVHKSRNVFAFYHERENFAHQRFGLGGFLDEVGVVPRADKREFRVGI